MQDTSGPMTGRPMRTLWIILAPGAERRALIARKDRRLNFENAVGWTRVQPPEEDGRLAMVPLCAMSRRHELLSCR